MRERHYQRKVDTSPSSNNHTELCGLTPYCRRRPVNRYKNCYQKIHTETYGNICVRVSYNKVADFTPAALSKRNSDTDVFL